LASSKISSASGLGHEAQLQRHWNKIWNVKCRQIKSKSDIVFSGDAQSMSTVDNLLAKSNKLLAQQKTRSGIRAGAVAAVILAIVGAVCFFALGYNIKVPESVTIAPENVEVLGPFANVLKVAGNGVTMRSIDNGTWVAMSIEFEVSEDLVAHENALAEKEMKKVISERKWNARDVIRHNLDANDTKLEISISHIEGYTLKKIVPSICKLEPGTVKKFDIPVSPFNGSTVAENREITAKMMSTKTLQIITSNDGWVINETRREYDKSENQRDSSVRFYLK
jgi:hypothetical protein